MKYTKKAVSIADQIARLEKRGLVIVDKRRAEKHLSNISYYRLRRKWAFHPFGKRNLFGRAENGYPTTNHKV